MCDVADDNLVCVLHTQHQSTNLFHTHKAHNVRIRRMGYDTYDTHIKWRMTWQTKVLFVSYIPSTNLFHVTI